jgi:hypothetical protein
VTHTETFDKAPERAAPIEGLAFEMFLRERGAMFTYAQAALFFPGPEQNRTARTIKGALQSRIRFTP